MPIQPNKIHVLLWSFSQGCFHFETLDKTIECGIRAYAANRNTQDYIVLAVGETREELEPSYKLLLAKFGRHKPATRC